MYSVDYPQQMLQVGDAYFQGRGVIFWIVLTTTLLVENRVIQSHLGSMTDEARYN